MGLISAQVVSGLLSEVQSLSPPCTRPEDLHMEEPASHCARAIAIFASFIIAVRVRNFRKAAAHRVTDHAISCVSPPSEASLVRYPKIVDNLIYLPHGVHPLSTTASQQSPPIATQRLEDGGSLFDYWKWLHTSARRNQLQAGS